MALPTTVHTTPQPADQALLARLCAGDDAAFDAIFRTWYAPLVRFTARIVGDDARAEEVVQETMLVLWQRRASLVGYTSAQAWLFHAARNRALNVVRHDGMVDRVTPTLISASSAAARDDLPDADAALEEAEIRAAVDAAVAALPPRCREVFLLSRVDGVRQAEIAARLGISLKAVEAHITRALRELRQTLAPWLPRRG